MNKGKPCVQNPKIRTHLEAGRAAETTIGELRDQLRHRDRRIEELRRELDEERDLVRRLRENVEDWANVIESWKECFQMTINPETGSWTWEPFWEEHNALVDDWNDLARRWNRFLPVINEHRQNVGRPLDASKAQCAEVLRRHKAGESLRSIADETSLGLRTVRTIIAKAAGTDRATKKHRQRFERIELDRMARARRKRQRRIGDALPRRAQRVAEAGKKLIKEATGLGSPRIAA